jgi:hypothetical protein
MSKQIINTIQTNNKKVWAKYKYYSFELILILFYYLEQI